MGSDGKHHGDYSRFSQTEKHEVLEQIVESYQALADGQTNWVCNLANAASLLWHGYHSLAPPSRGKSVNWAGFYVMDKNVSEQLILGPFQGLVACQTIKIGRGVCGTAAGEKLTQLVPDVEKFPGHIACDGITKSEIVVPIVDAEGVVRGVIDLDNTELEGFDEVDQKYLELLAKSIAETCEW
ncbi:L-methionine (R)-S-oxide reductase [Saccharomycopsis crataegensis]|uniref:L-methionine (R)-S-oxide reductase n=1 Tax=Saccharomycopsis crataegensis TaxID=43959 RepID=A0AAV5QTA9_9ASCO|nr:L-methionine (R)-S-oxide reductase [Saccharomycopsis crataegensis]